MPEHSKPLRSAKGLPSSIFTGRILLPLLFLIFYQQRPICQTALVSEQHFAQRRCKFFKEQCGYPHGVPCPESHDPCPKTHDIAGLAPLARRSLLDIDVWQGFYIALKVQPILPYRKNTPQISYLPPHLQLTYIKR